jgi:hypothetical protein
MLALAACSLSCSLSRSGSASGAGWSGRGPAWPKPVVRELDGGESLAPRAAARAIAAIVDDRPADKASADKPAPAASTGTTGGAADKPAAAPSAVPAPDEAITTEEIVIEIED